MKVKDLSAYMISALLLAKVAPPQYQVAASSLQNIALPVALSLANNKEQDVFCSFLQAVFEDYDLDKALSLVKDLEAFASDNILLKGFASEIKSQALLLIFETKCKLFRTVDLAEISKAFGTSALDASLEKLSVALSREGMTTKVDKKANIVSCVASSSADVAVLI